jgi:hypothetical protein
MNVVAVEYGNRPKVWSKARRFAPEGTKLLAELLGKMGFADDAVVVLDWDNSLREQPDEAAKPVLRVQTGKTVGERTLIVTVRLDVEDVFGNDTMVAEDFLRIVQQMAEKTDEAVRSASKE